MAIQPNTAHTDINDFQPKDILLSHVWNSLDKDNFPPMFAGKLDEAKQQIASDYKEDGMRVSIGSQLQSSDKWVESVMAQAFEDLSFENRDIDSLTDFSKRAKKVSLRNNIQQIQNMQNIEPTGEKDELMQQVMLSLNEENHPPVIHFLLDDAKQQIQTDYDQDGNLKKSNFLKTKGQWVETLMAQAFDEMGYKDRSTADLSDFSKRAREISLNNNLEELSELKASEIGLDDSLEQLSKLKDKHDLERTAEDLRELGVGIYKDGGVVDDLGFDPKDYDTVLENTEKMLAKFNIDDSIDIVSPKAEEALEQDMSYSPNTPRP